MSRLRRAKRYPSPLKLIDAMNGASRAFMVTKLQYKFARLCRENQYRHDSEGTKAQRRRSLDLAARQLKAMNYKDLESVGGIKGRHINSLLSCWREGMPEYGWKAVSPDTVKNRLAHLRWALKHVGRESVMLRDNDAYLVPRRSFVATESKGEPLNYDKLALIEDHYTQMSLRLMSELGIRRETSIKIKPAMAYAPGADMVLLKKSWTKGGRPGRVLITKDSQRQVLNEAIVFAEGGSLIPREMKYVEQLRRFEYWTDKVGIRSHSLRHQYALDRYRELSGGLEPPVLTGGDTVLTEHEWLRDQIARMELSEDLNHSRKQIVSTYIGTSKAKII